MHEVSGSLYPRHRKSFGTWQDCESKHEHILFQQQGFQSTWMKKLWMKNREGNWKKSASRHVKGQKHIVSCGNKHTCNVWWVRHVGRKWKLLLSKTTSSRSEFDLWQVIEFSQELLTNELIQLGWMNKGYQKKQKLHQLPCFFKGGTPQLVRDGW